MDRRGFLASLLVALPLASLPSFAAAAEAPFGTRDLNAPITEENTYRLPGIYAVDAEMQQDGSAVTGSFNAYNTETDYVGPVAGSVEVWSADMNTLYLRKTVSDQFSLSAGEKRELDYSVELPALSSGSYVLRAQMLTGEGRRLGWDDLALTVKNGAVTAAVKNTQLGVAAYKKDFDPLSGPNVAPNGAMTLKGTITNTGTYALSVTPVFTVYPFDMIRGNGQTQTFAPITLQPGASVDYALPVTASAQSQVESGYLQFVDATGRRVSPMTEYHWVVKGENADILPFRVSYMGVKKGDQTAAEVDFVGPADAVTKVTGTVEITLSDSNGTLATTTMTGQTLTDSIRSGNVYLTLGRNAVGTQTLTATIKNTKGAVLATRSLALPSKDGGAVAGTLSGAALLALAIMLALCSVVLYSRSVSVERKDLGYATVAAMLSLVMLASGWNNVQAAGNNNGIEVFTPASSTNFHGLPGYYALGDATIALFINAPIHNAPTGTYAKNNIPLQYSVTYAVCQNRVSEVTVFGRVDLNGNKLSTLNSTSANWQIVTQQSYTAALPTGCTSQIYTNPGPGPEQGVQGCFSNGTFNGHIDLSFLSANVCSTTLQMVAKLGQSGLGAIGLTPTDQPNTTVDATGDAWFAHGLAHAVNLWLNLPCNAPAQCSDGIDNDSDGLIDMADPGCSSPTDTNESDDICRAVRIAYFDLQANQPANHYIPSEFQALQSQGYNVTYFDRVTTPAITSGILNTGSYDAAYFYNGCGGATGLLTSSELSVIRSFYLSGGDLSLTADDNSGDSAHGNQRVGECQSRVNQIANGLGVNFSGLIDNTSQVCQQVTSSSPVFTGENVIGRNTDAQLTLTGNVTWDSTQPQVIATLNSNQTNAIAFTKAEHGHGAVLFNTNETGLESCGAQKEMNLIGVFGFHRTCPQLAQCQNGVDDDGDGLIDANDPGCHTDFNRYNSASYVATGNNEASNSGHGTCANGIDDDNDLMIDAQDPDCHTDGNPNNNSTFDPNRNEGTSTQCSNNTDDDGDGLVDANDPGCHSDFNRYNSASYVASGNNEAANNGHGTCADGKDNDSDGQIDAQDSDCHSDGNPNNNSTFDPNRNEGGSCQSNTGVVSNVLNSIYSVVVGGTDNVTLNQSKTTAYCNGNDMLLAGAGTGPSCDNSSNPACNRNMNYELDSAVSNGNQQGWTSDYSTQDDATYDTTREEAICIPNNSNTSQYFSTYVRTSGPITDYYSINQQKNLAYCDAGDLAIAGAGTNVFCDKPGDGGCAQQMLEYNGYFIDGNREGWSANYSTPGDRYYDTIQTTVTCLKKTAAFDQNFRVYHVVNQASPTDYYSMNQNRTQALCNPGDIAIGGGGNPAFCDKGGDPACGHVEYLESNRKITVGSQQGWESVWNLDQNGIADTQHVEVTCLALVNSCTNGTPQCSDNQDNDGDGLVDSNDPGCHSDFNRYNSASYVASGNNEAANNGHGTCADGKDNDSDGQIDAQDSDCHSDGNPNNNSTFDPNRNEGGNGGQTQCNNSIDDDGDGLIDSNDPGCHSDFNRYNSASYVASGNNEAANNGHGTCADGKDNDNDGQIDAQDSDCHTDGNTNNNSTFDPNRNEGGNSGQGADLSVTLTGPSTAVQNSTVIYTATVTNNGPAAATNVTLTDPPAGFTFLPASSTAGCVQNGTQVTCTLASLAAGSSQTFTLAFTVSTATTCNSTVTDTATVTSSTTDPNQTNNTSTAVSTTISCGTTGNQCSDGIDNDGDGLIDTQDPDCHSDGNPSNFGSYDGTRNESNNNGNTGCLSLSVSDDPDPAQPGGSVDYTIKLQNSCGTDKTVTVKALLDSDMEFEDASGNGNDTSSDEVQWKNVSVSNGSTKELTLTVNLSNSLHNGDQVKLQVTTPDDSETETTDIESNVTPPPQGQTLAVTVQPDRSDARAGDVVTYTITAKNNGTVGFTNATLQSSYTSGQLSILDAAGGTVNGTAINWQLGNLDPNTSRQLRYTTRIGTGMQNGDVVANTVTLSANGQVANASSVVRIVSQIPQTGVALGAMLGGSDGSSFLSPFHGSTTGGIAGLLAWITTLSGGLGAGVFGARKYFI